MNVKEKIIKLKETSSTNDKIELLKTYVDDKLFLKVLKATYDKSINYYIKKFNKYDKKVVYFLDNVIDDLLDNIATRKITGNTAKQYIEDMYAGLSSDDKYVLELILNRDLGCGISITTINKVIPNFLPDPKKVYMRCDIFKKDKFEKTFEKGEMFYIQEKMDGVYTNYSFKKQEFISRNLKTLTLFESQPEAFTNLIDELNYLYDEYGLDKFILQGELLVVDNNTGDILPREIGNGMINSKNKKFDTNKYKLQYYLWDIITIDTWLGKRKSDIYDDRWDLLDYLLYFEDEIKDLRMVESQLIRYDDNFFDNVDTIYKSYIEQGKEGIVIKYGKGIWEGKTSKYQMKYKKDIEVDLAVTDILNGKTGKNKDKLSILHCESSDGKLQVNVGSGLTDEMLRSMRTNKSIWLGSIVTIKAFDIIQTNNEYSLYLPRFVELRQDKVAADDIGRIKEISKI